jgi:hypothetical protein
MSGPLKNQRIREDGLTCAAAGHEAHVASALHPLVIDRFHGICFPRMLD